MKHPRKMPQRLPQPGLGRGRVQRGFSLYVREDENARDEDGVQRGFSLYVREDENARDEDV
jgi:hypothetical protein